MNEDRWVRYAPLSGTVALILIVLGAVLVNNYEYLKPSAEIVEKLEADSSILQIAGYISALSAFFVIWFSGSLRVWLREAEGGSGRLSAVAFGGGVATAAGLTAGTGALIAAAARAGSDLGISEGAATALWDFNSTVMGTTVPIAMGALVGAAAIVAFRTGVSPRWWAWVSAVIAVGLLSPVNYIFVGFGMLWIGVMGIWLYVGDGAGASPG